MTFEEFRQALTATEPPAGLTQALTGLWFDAKGDWTRAHESAQQDEGAEGSWVHAYLHRKESELHYSGDGMPLASSSWLGSESKNVSDRRLLLG
jgi:hypothetical protein